MPIVVVMIMRMIMIVGVIVIMAMMMLRFNDADVRLAVNLDIQAGARVRYVRAAAYDDCQRLADQLEVRCHSFGIFRLPRGREHIFSWLTVDRNVDLNGLGRDWSRRLRVAIQYVNANSVLSVIMRELRVMRRRTEFNDMAIVRARFRMDMVVGGRVVSRGSRFIAAAASIQCHKTDCNQQTPKTDEGRPHGHLRN